MIQGLSDAALMRIAILVAALVLILVIWFTARRKSAQGRRIAAPAGAPERSERTEPTLRELIETGQAQPAPAFAAAGADSLQSERTTLEMRVAPEPDAPAPPRAEPLPGARPSAEFDKIVSVFLVARAGQSIAGPDLVVAAEKAGLVYGHMNIFHRLVDNHPELGPIFSVANLVKPGHFDMATIKELHTPAVNFFITLPAPIPALDAWDTLLPTAQRMAELLDAVLLDGERNALGRQRIANIRDEMRAYDRAREKQQIRPGR
jgi:cell division protein ZipA